MARAPLMGALDASGKLKRKWILTVGFNKSGRRLTLGKRK